MAWDDISDLASDFGSIDDLATDIGAATQNLFDQSGLGIIDSGGALQYQTEQNLANPEFDPSIYQRQENYHDRAMRNAQRRKEFLDANPMQFEQLPLADQAIIGAGQGALDLTRAAAGLADAAFIPGARALGDYAGRKSQELDQLTSGPETSGLGATLQVVARGGMSVLPSLLAGPFGGFKAAVAAGGLQSAGSVFEDAQDGYIRQGYTPMQARIKAYAPSVVAGLITAGVTQYFGETGIEALSRGLSKDAIKQMIRAPIMEIIGGAGKEAAEEAIDQVGQGIVERWTYNPDKTIGDIVLESMQAGGLGGLLGGLGEAAAVSFHKATGGGVEEPAAAPRAPVEPPPIPQPRQRATPPPLPTAPIGVAEPIALPNAIPAPTLERVPTVGLRRGKRGPESLGVRILSAIGVDEATATEFVKEFTRHNPPSGDLEAWRNSLLTAFNASGLESEGAASLFREKPEDYEAMGYNREQAEAYARDAKKYNADKREGLRRRNKSRMEGLRRGSRAAIPAQTRVELQVAEPSDAQKEAGNYKKAHINLDGLDVAIENVEGSVRRGRNRDGTEWAVTMPADYGYFKKTEGRDGDAVDVYVGPLRGDPDTPVFVVDQVNDETRKFDEHKVLYGYPDIESALAAYDAAFSDGKGPQRRGAVTPMTQKGFRNWLDKADKNKPVAYRPGMETVEMLRASEVANLPPEGRPIDLRERAEWLNKESKRIARIDHEGGWQKIREWIDLVDRIKNGEVARVPKDASAVKISGRYRDVIITPSVQPGFEGQWQATSINKDGTPWSHSNHPTLEAALKYEIESTSDRVTDIRFKKGGKQNATIARKEQENNQREYLGTDAQRAPTEAGDRNRNVEGGIVPQAQAGSSPEVALQKGGESNGQEKRRKEIGKQNAGRQNANADETKVLEPEAGAAQAPAPKPRTRAEQDEYNALLDKKRLGPKQAQRLAELEKKEPYRKNRRGPEQWDDIISLIDGSIGKIRGKKTMKSGSKGYYGEAYNQAITMNALKPLFTNKGGGLGPDDVLQALRDKGLMSDDDSVDDLWDALIKAAGNRNAVRRGETKEQKHLDELEKQAIEFSDVAIENKRKNKKEAKAAKPVSVRSMIVGDEFEIDGEKFEVSNMEFDDAGDIVVIEVSDGRRFGVQRLGADMVIYPDRGAIKPATPESAAFDQGKVVSQSENKPIQTSVDAEGQQVLEAGTGGTLKEIPGQDLDARHAQMRADQNTPLAAPPIQTQGDMFGGTQPENADIPLFDQNSNQVNDDDPFSIRLVESSDLPANVKAVWKAWMETPLMRDLDWSGLRIELHDYLQNGTIGSKIGNLIKLAERGARGDVLPHEIAHFLQDNLSDADKQVLDQARMDGLQKLFPGKPQFFALFSKGTTSKEFRDQIIDKLRAAGYSDEQIDEIYKHSNPGEFYAHFIGEKFARQHFENRNKVPTVWTKLRDLFNAFVDSLRRTFGLKPTMDQIYRQTIAGQYKPNLDDDVDADEQNTFSATARQARNAAELARTQAEREIEGRHQLAQSFNITEFLTRHGAGLATAAAQRLVGYMEYLGIRAVGTSLNNGTAESYQQIKARTADQYQRNWMARLASVHVASFESKLKDAITAGAEAAKRITSPVFLKKLARRAALEQKTNNTKLLDEAAAAMLESAHRKAIKVLREEAKNDIDVAEAEGMVKAIEEAKNSSSAMSILINDMIKVLSSSQDGINALNDPNVTQKRLREIYSDLKRSTGQPLFNPNLMGWASNILARNAELRDALWASQLARNSSVRAQMGPYEKKFLADLEADPLKTIRREMREAKKRTSDYERARFAYLTINKEVTRELEQLQSQLEAAEIAQNVLDDPEFKAFRKEVYDDAQVEGTQRPFVAFVDKVLVLPDGTEVNVDPEFIKGSKTFFNQMRNQYLKAVSTLQQWLSNPDNAEDPNWQVHRRNLTELQDYFTSIEMLKPADSMRMMNTAMTILRDVIDVAGGRIKAAGFKAANVWNRIKQDAGWWNQEWSEKLTQSRIAAMKSHGLKWSELGQRDMVWANREWWKNVGNFLAYTHQRQQGGFKVGDRLPSGWTVTREDMANLRLQADMITAGFDILKDDQITEDYLGEIGLFRRALKGEENMVRRVFNDEMLDFARLYSTARAKFQEAFRAKDQAAMDLYEQEMIDALNQHWDQVGFAFIWDRNPEFASATIFDGENNAFDVIGKRMLNGTLRINSFEQLIDEIVSLTGVDPDEAKQTVMVEWGRIINNWHQQAKDDTEGRMILPVRGARAKNATTRSRNNALAPFSFYEYGFKDARSVAAFAGGLHSRALDRVVSSLIAIEQDLDRQIKDLAASPDINAAKDKNALARKNGDTYDNYQSLESRKKKVSNMLRELTSYDPDQDVDVTFGRTIAAQTGALVMTVRATTRNFASGPVYIGTIMNRLLGSVASAYPTAFIHAYWEGAKGWFSVGYSGVKWLGQKISYNIADIARAIVKLAHRDFRGAGDELFRGLADALGREAISRVKSFKRLLDAGMIYVPDFETARQNEVMGSYAYTGRLSPRQMGLGEKILQIPAMLFERPLSILRAFMPMIGDVAINSAMVKSMESRFGPFAKLEERLKNLFLDWQKHPYRQFDFANIQSDQNIFSHKEIFPKTIDSEKSFLELTRMFQEAGLSFHELATDFFRRLQANPKESFLTEEQKQKLSMLAIDMVNRSSPAGSPRRLQRNDPLTTFIRPFMSWKVRTLQIFNRLASVPAQSERSRKAQWAYVWGTLLLPMMLMNALIQVPAEETDRFLTRVMHNQEKSTRHPWERDGLKSQAIGWSLNATMGIPFLDIAMNTMLNDLPVRASLNPDLVVLEKAKDVARYLGGVVQTGDPFFRLPELIGGLYPDSKAILNRLASQEGKRASANVIALMRRFGQTELLRETGEPVAGVNYNALSPYGPAMENAAMRGDKEEFRRLFNEAVVVAKGMGRPEPERVVKQLFQHRNPYDRAFKQKLTSGQRQAFLARLSEGQKAQVIEMEQRFTDAANIAGVTFNVVRNENRSGGAGTLTRGRAGVGLSSLNGIRRVGGVNRRSTVGLRRR